MDKMCKGWMSLPVVVRFAVEFHIPGVARIVEAGVAHAALKTVLMVAGVGHSHKISVVDLGSTSFTDFIVLFAFQLRFFCGEFNYKFKALKLILSVSFLGKNWR